jgi:hypothetical protein
MNDSRLTQIRDSLAEVNRIHELQTAALLRDTLELLDAVEEDTPATEQHNLLDIAQARSFLRAAHSNVELVGTLIGLAVKEIDSLEGPCGARGGWSSVCELAANHAGMHRDKREFEWDTKSQSDFVKKMGRLD